MPPPPIKYQNLRGQTLPVRCLETGFITTAPALTCYQQGRDIDPTQRKLVGKRPANWVREIPKSTCEHCGAFIHQGQPMATEATPAVQAVSEIQRGIIPQLLLTVLNIRQQIPKKNPHPH